MKYCYCIQIRPELNKGIFIGIQLTGAFSKPIGDFVNKYSDLKPINWVHENNLHITIYFIGFIEEMNIPVLSVRIKNIINQSNPFTLNFEEICYIKGRKNQKMLWAKFIESNELNALAIKIEEQCLPFIEKRERFTSTVPHITLARFKQFKNLEKINPYIPFKTKSLSVIKCNLYESVSIEGGVRYEILETFYFNQISQ